MNNIMNKVLNYSFPKKICMECNESLVDKSLIFKNIKKYVIQLCDYHIIKKSFIEYVDSTLILNPEPENLFSDNGNNFHNHLEIDKQLFYELVLEILNKRGINKYHFCCDGKGIMYYQ